MNKITSSTMSFINTKGTYYFDPKVKKCIIENVQNADIILIVEHQLDLLFLQEKNAQSKITIQLTKREATVAIREIAITKKHEVFNKTIEIIHLAPATFSDYKFFGFAINQSNLSISAKSKIKPLMKRSEAHQILRVLTDDQAKAKAQPGLFIDNFDVKASHGNSIGQVSKREIYYLQTKGINQKIARWMIIQSYIIEALSILSTDKQNQFLNKIKKQLSISN